MGTLPTAVAFPDKPIRFIVGFPPGGSSDAMARIVQPGLEKQLGQPVVIENKPGAGAMIGIDAVAKSAPDGYTIGLGGAGAFGTNLAMGEKMPYDPHKDIVPVTGLAGSPFILAAAPSLKGKSLRDIIAMAKSDPGKLAIGHGGNGTGMHLTAELINQMAGTKIALVPYRGMAPVLNDLIGSHIALGITDPPSAMAAMEAGKIETVAISSAKRFSRLPNIPTLDESGLPGFEVERLVRHRGARRHAARRDREAQRRVRQGAQGSGGRGAHPRARLRADADDAARVRRLHRARSREVGEGGEGGWREGELMHLPADNNEKGGQGANAMTTREQKRRHFFGPGISGGWPGPQ